MKTRDLALWVFVAFLLGACGGENGEDDKAVCGNGIVEKGEECDDDSEACQDCKIAPGWECPPGEDCFPVEICDNGEDDTGNGLTDCEDPYCETHPNCVSDCNSQGQCVQNDTAVEVCMEGICRMASAFNDKGEVLVGEVRLMNQFDRRRTNPAQIKSFTLQYFHPAIPGSAEPLTCEKLAELARANTLDGTSLNVIRTAHRDFSSQDGDTYLIPDTGVPATSDVPWLALTRFYEGNRETLAPRPPTGRMLAFSCAPALHVFSGAWDPSWTVTVDAEPTCTADSHCADGWTCVTSSGICVYRACDPPCDHQGETCRQLSSGEPACLQKCHETLPCGSNMKCDKTPGWEPACFDL